MQRSLNSIKSFLCVLCILCGSFTARNLAAQSAQIPAPPQDKPIVIKNATIHTVTNGTIEAPSYLVFENGRITNVGRGEAPRIDGADVIDASDLHVFPGLISSETTLGLTEIGSVDVTQDSRELGDFTPEVRAAVAVNPDTDLIPVTRANGILLGLTFPSGGIISGRCSAIRFDGWTWEDMAIDDTAGLVLNWPRTEPVFSRWGGRGRSMSAGDMAERAKEAINSINEFFDAAERYLAARESDDTVPIDSRYEAMRGYVTGEEPIYVRADSAGQIESAVAWANRRGLRIVIVGGREADEAAPVLAKHQVPVIIGGTHRTPSRRHDNYDTPFTLPKKLHEGGVLFSIGTGGQAAHERNLNHQAATAAAYGLPREEAFKSVTINAAKILGIDEEYGSLESDKSATMIISTGDPLEITSDVLVAFIDGRRIDLGSRHKRLYEKYQEKYRQLGLIESAAEEGAATGSDSE